MPIIIPDNQDTALRKRLSDSGAAVITKKHALHQDIRPARIGILNLMPAVIMEATEVQWLRFISHTILQVEPILMKFDNDPRERSGTKRQPILAHYTPFSQVIEQGLDGLIITGDNLELRRDTARGVRELLPFDEIHYSNALRGVIDWAYNNVPSTVYSCLAAHFMLYERFGLEREIGRHKVFGVFSHTVDHRLSSDFVANMDDILNAPHSRWGNIKTTALKEAGLDVLADNSRTGWLLAQAKNLAGGYDLLIQGHPEYDRHDLHTEFERDHRNGQKTPAGYYPGNNPGQAPLLTWSNDARALHSNWINTIYRSFSGTT